MSDQFLGEIQIFGFNFAPSKWALCNGATLPISQYSALYSLIGVAYGGNGTSTFQLPNFAGRAACSQGTGTGLTPRSVGNTFGEDSVTLTTGQIPSHNHAMNIYSQPTPSLQSNTPGNGYGLTGPSNAMAFVPNPTANTTFSANTIGNTGFGQPHMNQQPLLALNFCIALQGIFPNFN